MPEHRRIVWAVRFSIVLVSIVWAMCAPVADALSTATNPTTRPVKANTSPAIHPNISGQAALAGGQDLTDLSIEQLMQVQVNTGTLTTTEKQLVPAAVTTIDHDEINEQNPRTLNDLLSIYVPNLEISNHPFELPSVGIRGIIGDNNTKYLTLVDGREMNERTHFGSLTEQDLYLLGDIDRIDVVRGPGSATYGPGAVEGVVSIQTFNGLTYRGTDLAVRGGFIDQFIATEIKHGQQLGPDSGWFIYAGSAQVTGSDPANSPLVEAYPFTAPDGTKVEPGNPAIFNYERENAEFQGQPQIKAHAEYDNGGVSIWARYSRGGEELDPTDRTYAPSPVGYGFALPPPLQAVGYQQITGFAGDKIALTDKLELDLSTSLDVTDYERYVNGNVLDAHGEDKLISKALMNWQMSPTNQLAVGAEYGYYWLGLPSMNDPGDDGRDSVFSTPQRWESHMFSLFGEDQWHINKQLTFFASARADKDRFTKVLYSPRGAFAWTPSDKDTFKLIGSQSLRTNTEEYMYAQYLNSHKLSPPETMNSLEMRYERQQTQNLSLASSIYYNRLAAINYNTTLKEQQLLGAYKTAGVELEANYRTQDDDLTLSQGYTKLVGQTFNSTSGIIITSAPYGFGYDLNDWSNAVTKLSEHHNFDKHLSADGNIQVMWGYKGSEEFLKYSNTVPFQGTGTPPDSLPGYTQPFGPSVTLNLGAEYKFDSHSSVRVDAYNVLSWFDQTLGKDDVLGANFPGAYRVQSPALALTYRLEF